MKHFEEIGVIFIPTQVYFSLTKDSLFKRNISHFGPTTLRATICSVLLTMADVKPGDVVVDPMCGGGSIPIEGKSGTRRGLREISAAASRAGKFRILD